MNLYHIILTFIKNINLFFFLIKKKKLAYLLNSLEFYLEDKFLAACGLDCLLEISFNI
jgi:hypothetical protein